MDAVPEILKKMEEISQKLSDWEINTDVLTQLESFPISVSVANEEGILEAVNHEFCNMSGYDNAEIVGKELLDFIPDNEKEYFHRLLDKLKGEPFIYSGKLEFINKKGKSMVLLSSISILKADGKNKSIILSLDASEQLKEKGKEIEKLTDLNTFISNLNEKIKHSHVKLISQETASGIVRHDLKNQLNSIVSLSEMLVKYDFSEKERKEMLHMITEAGKKALDEMDRTRSIELMERGQYNLKITEFDVIEMIDKIHEQLKVYFENKKVKLLVQSDNPKHADETRVPYFIQADQFFFEMMLVNLIRNAVEASPEGETILIDITSAYMSVEISIHNWGTVPKSIRDSFFEKYITKGKVKGTGLGTYICKMVTDAHEGMINMRTHKSTGTYVVLVLPKRNIQNTTMAA